MLFRRWSLCDGGRLQLRLNKSLFSWPVLLRQLDFTHLLGQEFEAGTIFQHKHHLPEGPEIRGSHGELVRGPGNRADGQRGEWMPKASLSMNLQQL